MVPPIDASLEVPPETGERKQYRVKRIKLPPDKDNKRPSISLVIDTLTGAPARIAMRWGIRRRAEGVTAKSLYQYNATIAWIYDWFARSPHSPAGDLDEFFTDGYVLTEAQIKSLIDWVDTKGHPELIARIDRGFRRTVSEPEVIAPKLDTMREFLLFALDPAQRKGKPSLGDLDLARLAVRKAIKARRPKVVQKPRKTEGGRLTAEQRDAIRAKIGWVGGAPRTKLWTPGVAMRNWLIFEVSYETGFRVSELAALTIKSLPKFSDKLLLEDDREAAWDRRLEEAGSKTFGRGIPVSLGLIYLLKDYVMKTGKPWGRKAKHGIEALWTRSDGEPLSVRMIEKVFEQISEAVGFRVTAHRQRHALTYNMLGTTEDLEAIMQITGHSSELGLKPYIIERQREEADAAKRKAFRRTEEQLARMPSEIL